MKITYKTLSAISKVLIIAVLLLGYCNAYAATERERSCDSGTGAPEGLNYDVTNGGKDVNIELTNPYCATLIAGYLAAKAGLAAMNMGCGQPVFPNLNPLKDALDILTATTKVTTRVSCAAGLAAGVVGFGAVLAQFRATYEAANTVYTTTSVCGANWMANNPKHFDKSSPGYKKIVEDAVRSGTGSRDETKYREWLYGGVEVEDNSDDEICYDVYNYSRNGEGKYTHPQKYYLRGLQTGNFNCNLYITQPGQNDPQTKAPFSNERIADFKTAYKCCANRSSNYICIQYGDAKKFCRGGSHCTVTNPASPTLVTRDIDLLIKTYNRGRLLCADTYSLCPYNFSLGGGSQTANRYRDGIIDSNGNFTPITQDDINAGTCSEKSEMRGGEGAADTCSYDNRAGKLKNYCQYQNHCTITSTPFSYRSGLTSAYFSTACLNFVGDSLNQTGYNSGVIAGKLRHFSAPVAQCFKETLENLFLNRAGHTKCKVLDEQPAADGTCPSGTYVYKMNEKVAQKSFFEQIQDNLRTTIKLVFTLSMMFFGMKLLITKPDGESGIVHKKDIVMYMTKMALVMFFAIGVGWQQFFFSGVYGAGSVFANMVMKISTDPSPNRQDGCQFQNITLPNGAGQPTNLTYPRGKSYLSIWDTLDCKIARYMGYGPEASEANIAMLILAGFFTGGVGLYFSLSIMIFGFYLIAMTIRALHIFITSAFSIILLVFISPIIIPTVLFEKTKNIFTAWLTQLIGFCFYPILLFAYIGITVTAMDKIFIGSATFAGSAPDKILLCNKTCKTTDGVPRVLECSSGTKICDNKGGTPPNNCNGNPICHPSSGPDEIACNLNKDIVVNPLNDSVACLIDAKNFGKFPGFAMLGISIPILINILQENAIERILTLLKAAMLMYLLFKFMDEIPGIAGYLTGVKPPESKLAGMSGKGIFDKVSGLTRAIQQRAGRGIKKLGGSAARGGIDAAKNTAASFNRGKGGAQGSKAIGGSSSTGGSGGGAAAAAAPAAPPAPPPGGPPAKPLGK